MAHWHNNLCPQRCPISIPPSSSTPSTESSLRPCPVSLASFNLEQFLAFILYGTDTLSIHPFAFKYHGPFFEVCLMFYHDQIQVIYSAGILPKQCVFQGTISRSIGYPSVSVLAIPLTYFLREMKTMCTKMPTIALLLIAKTWKLSRCSTTGEYK